MMKTKASYWIMPQMKRDSFKPKRTIFEVCNYFKIEKRQLLSQSRLRRFVKPREMLCYVLHVEKGMGCAEVGELLNRDHSSVIYHTKKVRGYLEIDRDYKELINQFI